MKRSVVNLSALLLCFSLNSCTSPQSFVQREPIIKEEPLDPVISDRLTEVLFCWDALLDKSSDPCPAAGSVRDEDENLIGSGILISPRHVLTAAHVADHDGTMFFKEYDDDCIQVENVIYHPEYDGTDVDHDIAIMTLREPSNEKPWTRLLGDKESDTMVSFCPVLVVGNSFDLRKISEPLVFKYYGRLMERPNIMIMLPTAASIWHGDSGGPVFTENGKLVGIVTHYRSYQGRPIMNGCASVEYYRDWIRSIVPTKD